MRRALIVANKWWEADPLVAALSSAASTTSMTRFVADNLTPGRRGSIEASRGRIEVWCIQELMSSSKSGSSTEEKARVLPPILSDPEVVLVVAFGTAATPTERPLNGNVVIGTKTFCHDPKAQGSSSHWVPPNPDAIVDSPLNPAAFVKLADESLAAQVKTLLIPVPIHSAQHLDVMVNYDYVALADINVTNYKDYAWADSKVVDAYRALNSANPIGSLETTHAVIRACTAAPFMFVSGITDRVGYFDQEVAPAPYGQNFVAAHNAGLAISYIIPRIATNALVVQ